MMLKTELRAFHGETAIKQEYLTRVRLHRLHDEVVKGQYWQDGKGCAVGCTVHSGSHADYETELGIPRVLARLEDGIFEALPNELAMVWPEQFLEAIPVGADLSMVSYRFMHWLLADETDGVLRLAKEDSKPSIQRIIDLFERTISGEEIPRTEWRSAYAAAAYADAYAYARTYARIRQSEKLLELLRAA